MSARPDLDLKVNGCTLPIREPEPQILLEEAHAVACLVTADLECRDERGGGGVGDLILSSAARAVETLIELAAFGYDFQTRRAKRPE